jgi:hypothetical protein
MRSVWIQTEHHPRLTMRALCCLSAKEPFRFLTRNLDLDDEFSAHVSRIVLSKSSVEFLATVTWIPKLTLSQCMIQSQEIESDD